MNYLDHQFNNPLSTEELEAFRLEETLSKPESVGKQIGNKGMYLGLWSLEDRENVRPLTRYHVYVAPEDLTDESGNILTLSYKAALKEVSKLKNWKGHDGCAFLNDRELFTALYEGSYDDRWFIPPLQITSGINRKHVLCGAPNLIDRFTCGEFAQTFAPVTDRHREGWHWTCSQWSNSWRKTWAVNFAGQKPAGTAPSGKLLPCRLFRLEAAP
jgi:hypothetical protein